MKRLFLDANVLFTAAHNPEGKAAFIIALGAQGMWDIYSSAFVLEEARRNIDVKYPSLLQRFNALLQSVTIAPERPDAAFPDALVKKDRPVFQAAVACEATHLITGDIAHFGKFMNKPKITKGMIVQTPSQFLTSLI